MLKKVCFVMIGLILMAGIVFAAGSSEKTAAESGEKKAPIKVTMMIRDRSSIIWEGSDLQKEVNEKLIFSLKRML